jgi:hypothetical protein
MTAYPYFFLFVLSRVCTQLGISGYVVRRIPQNVQKSHELILNLNRRQGIIRTTEDDKKIIWDMRVMMRMIARKKTSYPDLVIYVSSYTVPHIFLSIEFFSRLHMSEVLIMPINYTHVLWTTKFLSPGS